VVARRPSIAPDRLPPSIDSDPPVHFPADGSVYVTPGPHPTRHGMVKNVQTCVLVRSNTKKEKYMCVRVHVLISYARTTAMALRTCTVYKYVYVHLLGWGV